METIVYLIRHSVKLDTEYYFDNYKSSKGIDDLEAKKVLSVDGEKRAEILSNEPELQNLDVIYVSDYVRTLQTAKYIMKKQDLKVNIDERLNERVEGIITPDTELDWWNRQYNDENFKLENGESRVEVKKRMNEAFNEIVEKNKGKRIAVFSHFVAISFLIMNWCKVEYRASKENNFYLYKFIFKDKVICDKKINQPEVFKLILDENNEVKDVKLVEFDDLKYQNEEMH